VPASAVILLSRSEYDDILIIKYIISYKLIYFINILGSIPKPKLYGSYLFYLENFG